MKTLALALFIVGCAGNPDSTQKYLGTWSFTSGDDNVNCPSNTTAVALSGNVTVKEASGGGLLVIDQDSCDFTYEVASADATTRDQSCSFAVPQLGQGVTAMVSYTLITLATSDGKSMTDDFNGTVDYASSAGTTHCVFSGSGALDKIATD